MHKLKRLRELIKSHRQRVTISKKVALRFGENSDTYKKIMLACDLSRDTHRGGKRRNGEPLIYHERAIFIIALEYLGVRDVDLLIATFLHDMPEDYPDDWKFVRIDQLFGKGVSRIVNSVTKPSRTFYKTDAKHSKAMFSKVVRGGRKCMTLKCIDRLHNMITLYGSKKKKVEKVYQTIEHVLPMSVRCDVLVHELMLATTEQMHILKLTRVRPR